MSNNIIIRNLDPQEITINEGGTVTGITNVYVNGTDVTIGTKAYVIVPTKLSELTNDEGFITNAEETDPTVPSYVKNITQADINSWNDKQDELVSTQNIKSINGNSILGSGNLNITTEYIAGVGIDITDNTISNTITSYNDLTDTPTPIQYTSQLINDSGYITNRVDDLQNYLTTSVLESILPHSSDSGTGDLYLQDSANYKLNITLNPSEIEQKTYTGKNLFLPTETWDTWYGISCSILDQIITWNGTSTTGIARKICDVNLPAETYTFTLTTIGGTHTSGKHIYVDYMQGNTKIGGTNFTADGSKTTTLSDSIDNIKLGFDSADTFDNYQFIIQLEQGSTATSYEPYVGGMPSPNPLYPQDIHVVTGENSITVSNKNLFSEWISGTVNTTTGEITSVPRNMTDYISVNPSTSYALWREDTGFATYFMEYDINKGFVREQHISSANTTGIFTTSATTKFVILFQYTSYSPTNKAQLEVGSTVTSYVPHQETVYPIDLGTTEYLKIGDTADRIYKNVPSDPDYHPTPESSIGKWLIKETIYITYIADTGDFDTVTEYSDYYLFQNNSAVNIPRPDYDNRFGVCEYFGNDTNNSIYITGNTLWIKMDKKIGISTVEDLNTWISTNQPIAYFINSGSDYGQFIEEQQEQWNALNQAMAYEGGTNITQENDDLPFDIVADTLKKISS